MSSLSHRLGRRNSSSDRKSVDSEFSIASPVNSPQGAIHAEVITNRRDSDVARDLSDTLNRRREDSDSDIMATRMRQEHFDAEERSMADRSSVRDAQLAAAIYHGEMEDRNEIDGRYGSIDYVKEHEYTPWFSRVITVVLCIMMLVEIGVNNWDIESLQVNPLIGPSTDTLDKLGAKDTPLILEGQFWRLLTAMLLHAGVIHLVFNLIAMYNVGFPLEREFGTLKIAIIFVTSGFTGDLLSSIFLPQTLSVGASGAIFGLFGAAWADLLQNWSLYGEHAKWVLLQLILATIVNLVLGLLPFLDNFAHFGGLCCGMFFGFTLLVQDRYDIWGSRKTRKPYQVVVQGCAIVTIPIMFIVLILVLYLQVDVSSGCNWCSYISCVPMPPGASDENLWWDCTECSTSADVEIVFTDVSAGDYEITCPDLSVVSVSGSDDPKYTLAEIQEASDNDDSSLLRAVCKYLCYDS